MSNKPINTCKFQELHTFTRQVSSSFTFQHDQNSFPSYVHITIQAKSQEVEVNNNFIKYATILQNLVINYIN